MRIGQVWSTTSACPFILSEHGRLLLEL